MVVISLLISCRTGLSPILAVPPAGDDVEPAASVLPLADWLEPPVEARPTARWWWPGGSVEPAGMARHLTAIQDAGFGAVEIQPLLLGLSEPTVAADARIRSVGTPAFFERLQVAVQLAAERGLAVDLTLGSGWPGGLPTDRSRAEQQLLLAALDVEGPLDFVGALPPAPPQSARRSVERILDVMGPMDTETERIAVLAARLGGEDEIERIINLTDQVEGTMLRWQVPSGRWQIMAFYTNTTAHFVMGGAYPGAAEDARVVDHLSARGADALIEGYGVPAMSALPHGSLRSVFVDSFELMGELPFTAGFLAAFQEQHGYDLTNLLPLVFLVGGESKYAQSMDRRGQLGAHRYRAENPYLGRRVREDYEATRQALFHEAFLQPIRQWAHESGATLRLQAHGGYGDYLDTYAMADIPESEGLFGEGSTDFLSLAASAAHVAGRRWVSSEAFIQLRMARTRLSMQEMSLLAGRAYAAGINRLVFHGLPYPYRLKNGRWWYPFPGGFRENLAGPLPITTHFDPETLKTLSDFNQTLSRLSVAMSHGEAVAEVAWLRSASGYPDQPSIEAGRLKPGVDESRASRALREQGLGHDRVSRRMLSQAVLRDGALEIGVQRYQALLLDSLPVAEPELVERLASIAAAGVPVIALGSLPGRAPGWAEASARDQRVRVATQHLEEHVIISEWGSLGPQLREHIPCALLAPLDGEGLPFSTARRQVPEGDVVLVFNESWSAQTATVRFCRAGGAVTLWDPVTGARKQARNRITAGETISLTLQAAQAQILTIDHPQ